MIKQPKTPRQRAEQILKRNGNNYQAAIAKQNQKMAKAPKGTLAYCYAENVRNEIQKIRTS